MAAIVVVVIAVAVWVTLHRGPSAGELESAADAFVPTAGWTLESEEVRGASFLCIDTSCPSVIRQWTSTDVPRAEELEAPARRGGWTVTHRTGACGSDARCELGADTPDGFRSEVRISGPVTSRRLYRMTLVVEP
jgi:hypothetical protein